MNPNAFRKLSYGVYIVSSKKDGALNGQLANVAFQISSDPSTLAVSINKSNLTHEFISASKVFSVSVLSQEAPMTLIGHFGFKSGRTLDKFKDMEYTTGVTGAPIVLRDTLAWFECELVSSFDVFTHTVFVGKIVNAELVKEGEAMTYAYYHKIKGGRTPAAAPTYVKQETKAGNATEVPKMKKYQCNVCGYVYDPAQGDPDAGIKPGTPFEELPDAWVCPVCGAPKSEFSPMP